MVISQAWCKNAINSTKPLLGTIVMEFQQITTSLFRISSFGIQLSLSIVLAFTFGTIIALGWL